MVDEVAAGDERRRDERFGGEFFALLDKEFEVVGEAVRGGAVDAVKLKFDDMHDTGIFSWNYLYELGTRQAEIWQAYLNRLEAEGKSRDP